MLGAGVMGLACAYYLQSKKNYQVDVYESADVLGGMACHFDFSGVDIERFYHFICKSDEPMFKLLTDLNIEDKLKWNVTHMGYYYQGRLYDWGNPVALLKFPKLNLLSKIRYGLHMFYCTKITSWSKLDALEAQSWIKRWIGKEAYSVLWEKLFHLKFYKYQNNLSAAWIWTRIKRVGTSRKNIFHEELGYLQGGSKTILTALSEAIVKKGGVINLSHVVDEVARNKNNLFSLKTGKLDKEYDAVVSTIPLPYVPDVFPFLPDEYIEKYRAIDNMAVVCVIVKSKKPVTRNFWLNINDNEIEIPGLIEYTNLNRMKDSIIYAPFYLPVDHPKMSNSDDTFAEEAISAILKINTELNRTDILDISVSRYGRAQPVCSPGFKNFLPDMNTPIKNLIIGDTTYYYPEDRSISESVRVGKEMAEILLNVQAGI